MSEAQSSMSLDLSKEGAGSPTKKSRRFRGWKVTWGGGLALGILIAWLILAAFANVISPFDPLEANLTNRMLPPFSDSPDGRTHYLGTDELGRDVLSRVIYGSRVSLMVVVLAVPISMTLGAFFGITSGYIGGLYENIVMRFLDVQLALPFILVALAVLVAIGPGFRNIVLLLGITGWTHYARILRGQTLSLRERDFVGAAKMIGSNPIRIIFKHILPNTASLVIVLITLQIPQVIVAEASLSFLGLGIQPPSPSWGGMLSESRLHLFRSWWLPVFPGICITLAALSGNLLGDWINDQIDPHQKNT